MPDLKYRTDPVYQIYYCPLCNRFFYRPGKEFLKPFNRVPITNAIHEVAGTGMIHLMYACAVASLDDERQMCARKSEREVAKEPEGFAEWIM